MLPFVFILSIELKYNFTKLKRFGLKFEKIYVNINSFQHLCLPLAF